MKPTLVVNIRSGAKYDVLICRPSKWGNIFTHVPSQFLDVIYVGSREEAVRRYREWIKTQPQLLARLHELRGKVLGCICSEYVPCHGHVLAEMADALGDDHG